MIRLGPESLNLLVTAILDQHGKYVGPMLTWEVVTEQIAAKEREAETAADMNALNQLLVALGEARTKTEVAAVGARDDPRSVRLALRDLFRGRPGGPCPQVRQRVGLGRRGVPPGLA